MDATIISATVVGCAGLLTFMLRQILTRFECLSGRVTTTEINAARLSERSEDFGSRLERIENKLDALVACTSKKKD